MPLLWSLGTFSVQCKVSWVQFHRSLLLCFLRQWRPTEKYISLLALQCCDPAFYEIKVLDSTYSFLKTVLYLLLGFIFFMELFSMLWGLR